MRKETTSSKFIELQKLIDNESEKVILASYKTSIRWLDTLLKNMFQSCYIICERLLYMTHIYLKFGKLVMVKIVNFIKNLKINLAIRMRYIFLTD